MEIIEKEIEGVYEIIPRMFADERGYFFESFSQSKLEKYLKCSFEQDNQSFSHKNVLRGLHFQKPPHAQAKLVRVVTGKALDIAVDIRKDSPTFGQYISVLLDSTKNNMFFVPEGFAHGFVTFEETIFQYKCSKTYNKEAEGGILWNDRQLNIDWQISELTISSKDRELPLFEDLELAF